MTRPLGSSRIASSAWTTTREQQPAGPCLEQQWYAEQQQQPAATAAALCLLQQTVPVTAGMQTAVADGDGCSWWGRARGGGGDI
jgi:hypothetical protein